jgi:ureidoglycolate dehydrogenase (NAD+)
VRLAVYHPLDRARADRDRADPRIRNGVKARWTATSSSAAARALPRAEGVDEITVPGERGDRVFAERGRTGIPIPPAIWKQLDELA